VFTGNPEIRLCAEYEIGVLLGDDGVYRKGRLIRW
jgi:hypothetical protein